MAFSPEASAGVGRCGRGQAVLDLAAARSLFGRWGDEVLDLARGYDPRPVVANRDSKSISSETTFDEALSPADQGAEIRQILNGLAEEVAASVQAEGFLPVTKSGADQLKDDEALAPFLAVLPDAQFYPSSNPKWQATVGAFKSLFGQIQSKPAQDVLTEIQAQVDAS